jgi:hypothetical protein
VVLCNQGLQYAQDTLAALAEAVLERTGRSSYGPDMTTVHEDTRRTLGQEVCAALQAYRDGDDFVIPCRNYLVHARVA